jgi:energy-converting hydrogenase A subunit M
VKIENLKVVSLPHLIQLKLAARRYYDFGDVVYLIRVHNLDVSYLQELHPSVHQDFIECLEEKRREDKYEASP